MKKALPFVLPALALLAAGCHDTNQPQSGDTGPTVVAPKSQTNVYVVNRKATGNQDPLTAQTIPLHKSQTPARDAIEALLQSPDSPIAKGTALRGITISSGVATVDFSQSPLPESGGEGPQSDALSALARTLGQFPEIRQYQVSVQGKPFTSFGEAGTLEGPMDVVRSEAAKQ